MSTSACVHRICRTVAIEVYEWSEMVLSMIPGRFGRGLRGLFYKLVLESAGPGISIGVRSRIQCPGAVRIGAHSRIGDNAWIAANANPEGWIHIGRNVLIGPAVIIHSGSHQFRDITTTVDAQGHRFAPVTIEDDVWIAARVTILAGVTVATGSVVAAGAVVSRSTEPYSVVAGVPARKISSRVDCG